MKKMIIENNDDNNINGNDNNDNNINDNDNINVWNNV